MKGLLLRAFALQLWGDGRGIRHRPGRRRASVPLPRDAHREPASYVPVVNGPAPCRRNGRLRLGHIQRNAPSVG